jgi:hypothetical protein
VVRARFLLLAAFLALTTGNAQTPVLDARASVDSTHYRVGDYIRVKVELHHPRGTVIRHATADSLGSFQVLERLPLEPRNDTATTTGVVVAKYDSGSATLPALSFTAVVPGDTGRVVLSNTLQFDVTTVPVDTSKDFKDLKPPLSVNLTTAEILGGTALILILAAAGYLGWKYYKRWRKRRDLKDDRPEIPERPAHVIALEQLAILKEKKLWQKGLVKEFYSEITEIFRRYLENRYAMMAMEETSDEILHGMRQRKFPAHMMEEAEKILRRADLVKFAKYQPVAEENEEMFKVVGDIVDRTKIVQMTPVPAQKAADHAVD